MWFRATRDIRRAVQDGRLDATAVREWMNRGAQREADGTFLAMNPVFIVSGAVPGG